MTRRVLAVDDQPEVLDVVRLALDVTAGWSVATATDAAGALDAAASADYDVVLLDLTIPGDDARRTIAALRGTGVTARILLLTGAGISAADARRLDADGLLAKPFDPLGLADQIEAALR